MSKRKNKDIHNCFQQQLCDCILHRKIQVDLYKSTTVDTMARLVSVMLVLVCQIGLSMQACSECTCCKGFRNCDSNKNCVDGCIDGYYGDKCTNVCLENCKTCDNGNECTECKPGYFTNTCSVPCGKGCVNNTCSLVSGECLCKSTNFIKGKCEFCKFLWYGNECNKTCPSNCGSCISDTECNWCKKTLFYGSYCQFRCSIGCVGGMCSKQTGHCINGCKPNYTGANCDTCAQDVYGLFCDLNCPQNCYECFTGYNCTSCKTGFYGETCTYACPSGCYGNCTIADGRCFECRQGFFGEYCDTCENGTYGVKCSKLCHEIDLNCQACILDELGVFKNCTKCNNGYTLAFPYGQSYSTCKICPSGCIDNICSTEGLCENGCVRGKWGDMCNFNCTTNCEECSQTDGACLKCTRDTFLDDCSKNCSINCNLCSTSCLSSTSKRVCDDTKGHCLFGCKKGFQGNRCDKLCSSQCINITCNQVTAECLYGCKDGFKGSKCLEAILPDRDGILIGSMVGSFLAVSIVVGVIALVAFKVWKRRNGNNKETNTHGYENTQVPDEYRTNEDTQDSDNAMTYEDLKSRDERLYSVLTTNQQLSSPPATDYVNCG